jgi:hypothetical protein
MNVFLYCALFVDKVKENGNIEETIKKSKKMESNDQRIEELNKLEKKDFVREARIPLGESLEDPEISSVEHKRLFDAYQAKILEFFPDLNNHPTEYHLVRHACLKYGFKKDPDAKKQTLREQLHGQIETGKIYDAGGKISPETLWGMICFQTPELKDKYSLDDAYEPEKDTTLQAAIVMTSASLAMHSQKTAHLHHYQ